MPIAQGGKTVPEISLTDFVDFVIKAGSPKLTKVRELFNRGEYSPAFDYWKQLRDHIADTHQGKQRIGSVLAGCGKTRLEADAVPGNTLVSTAQPDKKKACVEKTSSSWMCSAT